MRSRQTTTPLKLCNDTRKKTQCDAYGKICLVNKIKTDPAKENIPGCKILQGFKKGEILKSWTKL